MLKMLKSSWVYLLWFGIYFFLAWLILGANGDSFTVVLITYAISIAVALSPLGEWILRLLEGARPIKTQAEREYLMPIFEEVYEEAQNKHSNLSQNINIYIADSMEVNAYAMGRTTIAVTQGALKTFTPDQLRGVLAHEFGHIAHGHTKALLLNVVGNGIFTIAVMIFRLVITILQLFASIFNTGIIDVILAFFKFLLNTAYIIFMYLGQIILAINSRQNEYQADSVALQLGYGEELVNALYLLQEININQRPSLWEKLKSSHPHIAERIKRLENILNDGEELEITEAI